MHNRSIMPKLVESERHDALKWQELINKSPTAVSQQALINQTYQ